MSDIMLPIPFPQMLEQLMVEYKDIGTFYGVPFYDIKEEIPIGPAAGPHTQLAGNILAAYAAGATYFELKTVQILEREELHIVKPCIYVGHEVFNTEWSTELTIEQAKEEYIKAYLLLQVLSREFQLRGIEQLQFIMSVGYDLKGIQSTKVDMFINDMRKATNTLEWQQDIFYIKEHLSSFQKLTLQDIKEIEEADTVSNTVTLSTMHGCESSEIEKIAIYLLEVKGLNTYIKMNPTLVGKEEVRKLLDAKGYKDITYREEIFLQDITLDMAVGIIENCREVARQQKREFGIKLTNTFPVKVTNHELEAAEMYLSGPPLYPIAIRAAYLLAERLKGELVISYSGGADASNIRALLETGISCITVSSLLLKQGGYKNLTKLIKKAAGYSRRNHIDLDRLLQLTESAVGDKHYDKAKFPEFERKENYDILCAKCNNCVDVCPNRANRLLETKAGKYVIHLDRLCNECGGCASMCIKGHNPGQEKFTIFEDERSYRQSTNSGVMYTAENRSYRKHGLEGKIPEEIEQMIKTGIEKGRF